MPDARPRRRPNWIQEPETTRRRIGRRLAPAGAGTAVDPDCAVSELIAHRVPGGAASTLHSTSHRSSLRPSPSRLPLLWRMAAPPQARCRAGGRSNSNRGPACAGSGASRRTSILSTMDKVGRSDHCRPMSRSGIVPKLSSRTGRKAINREPYRLPQSPPAPSSSGPPDCSGIPSSSM